MRVETLGEGPPEVAVVGAVHGDEPCGVEAIERLLAEDPSVDRPVALVVANERALAAGDRSVDADLNRLLPGDPDSDVHEERLAAALVDVVRGCPTLGIHSTVSTERPFGAVAGLTPTTVRVLRAMPFSEVADFAGVVEGRCVNRPGFVDVECGLQGTDRAADQAYDCTVSFLRATEVLSGDPDETPTRLYDVTATVEKESSQNYRFLGENFQRVPAGEVYAETDDGDPLQAETDVWPVLMSADGHDTLLGYTSTLAGRVQAVAGD